MKIKKLLSVLVVLCILLSLFSLNVSAKKSVYFGTTSFTISEDMESNSSSLNFEIIINQNKICSLDGYSKDYEFEISKITCKDIDYLTNPDEFLEIFKDDNFKSATIKVDFEVAFETNMAFGELEYEGKLTGFSAPASTGVDILDGFISSLPVPTTLTSKGKIEGFPYVVNYEATVKPTKVAYYDNERFDISNVRVMVELNNNNIGYVTYSEDTHTFFRTTPSYTENLTVNDKEVVTFFDGKVVARTPIEVLHKWSCDADGNPAHVNITTNKYLEENPGFHAVVCEGCGETHDAQPHTPSPVLDENGNPKVDENGNVIFWTPNNDQTFVQNGTESSICSDCGTVLTRDTFGTADFNTTFGDMHFIKVIFEYINVLLRFIGAATY